jgi:hypothetical protein
VRLTSAIEPGVKAVTRALTVALAAASWIAISNHCAFAAVRTQANPVQSECPFHSKPAKPQPVPAGVQCCKILRAITTAPAKTAARAIVDLPHVDLAFGSFIFFAPAKISFVVSALDTGPPDRLSFAELVLQRSILAHAPPLFA